jgi:hypothetical protein
MNMKTYQWFLLGIGFMIIGSFFISMDTISPIDCDPSVRVFINQIEEGREISEIDVPESSPLDVAGVWCVMNAEMYDPFIWMFFGLSYLFGAIGFIELFVNWGKKK